MKTHFEKISLTLIFGLLGFVGMVLGCGGGGESSTVEDNGTVSGGSSSGVTIISDSFGVGSYVDVVPVGEDDVGSENPGDESTSTSI